MSAPLDAVDALADALDAGRGRLPDALVDRGDAVVAHARDRLALSGDVTVVALAGATGSGKSSLLNALAGADVARPGTLRPTTSAPLAVVHGDADAHALLDWLDVADRHRVPAPAGTATALPPGLVLLDLPDHDSVVAEHRAVAERLYARVDLLVWVLDPQKYADAAVHDRYLRPLAEHADVMVVALNQVDRLAGAERGTWLADARRLVDADGLRGVPVLTVSARTGEGVDGLRALLVAAAERRRAATQRLRADVRTVADAVLARTGDARVPRPDPAAVERAFTDAAGVPTVVAAVRASAARQVVARTGWPPLRLVGRLRADPLRRLHLRGPATSGTAGPGAAGGGAAGRRDAGRRDAGPVTDDAVDRTSLPPPGPQAHARAALAARAHVDVATAGLPDAWVLAARGALQPDAWAPDLDRAVAATPLLAERAPWWAAATDAVQRVLVTAAAAGLLWLAALAVAAYLRLPEPVTPEWGPLPAPTVLALGGVLLGLLLALVGRVAAGVHARGRAARARRRLHAAVGEVARRHVVGPVAAEVARWDRCRSRARAAR
ncbi:GTPase [Cellulomonas oligotrophica]|uniref:GTPase n=1 Tax=Cellulomonas oligotrophica TaxID=931536 RepID=UPI0031E60482